MKLQVLSEDGIEALKGGFDRNLPYYVQGDAAYFQQLLADGDFLQDTDLDVDENLLHQMDSTVPEDADEEKKIDAENAIRLHRALGSLPLYFAMEESMWEALTHTVLFPFICEKRKKFFQQVGKKDVRDKIYNYFFTYTKNGKRRGTFVNCVSSLWWGAQMLYDEKNPANPYAYVYDLAETGFPSTVVLFSSSRITGRRETSLGLFCVIHELRAAGQSVKRQDVVEAIKYLNLRAGMSILDFKTEDEIADMVREFYREYFRAEA